MATINYGTGFSMSKTYAWKDPFAIWQSIFLAVLVSKRNGVRLIFSEYRACGSALVGAPTWTGGDPLPLFPAHLRYIHSSSISVGYSHNIPQRVFTCFEKRPFGRYMQDTEAGQTDQNQTASHPTNQINRSIS